MENLSYFQIGQIFGACMTGASVRETSRMLDVSSSTVSKVVTAFESEETMSSAKHRSG
jgi:transposase